MAIKYLNNIDLNQNQLLNARVHVGTAQPTQEDTGDQESTASGIEVPIENRWGRFAEDSVLIFAQVCWGRNHARCQERTGSFWSSRALRDQIENCLRVNDSRIWAKDTCNADVEDG